MTRIFLALAFMLAPLAAWSGEDIVEETVKMHILPRFDALAERSATLAATAQDTCDPGAPRLRRAYGDAFDAWISASHLRFGPTEVNDRAFALAFWPDARGATPRALRALIADQDPVAEAPEDYAQVSIAARGFYALEYLLYDPALGTTGDPAYRCTLIRTMTADIAATTAAIRDDWHDHYADELLHPSADGAYRTHDEALKALFKALTAGLEFTADARLGRPLGTFDRPRPTRAEAHRSGRSARHVGLSLRSLRDLALHLARDDAALRRDIADSFDHALARLAALDDPVFAGVAEPQSRIRVEALQQSVAAIRTLVRGSLGPMLGVAAGFNALDGD